MESMRENLMRCGICGSKECCGSTYEKEFEDINGRLEMAKASLTETLRVRDEAWATLTKSLIDGAEVAERERDEVKKRRDTLYLELAEAVNAMTDARAQALQAERERDEARAKAVWAERFSGDWRAHAPNGLRLHRCMGELAWFQVNHRRPWWWSPAEFDTEAEALDAGRAVPWWEAKM